MLLSALSVGEKFSLGGTTTLLGLGMTFLVLVLLIGCIYLVSTINKYLEKTLAKKKQKKNVCEETPVAVEQAVQDNKEIDDETMLAIRSAVDIYVLEEKSDGKPHDNIKILSVKEL